MFTKPGRDALYRSAGADEGMALVLVLLFMLVLSALGATAMTTARFDTVSSVNYRMMSQARYGAESGIHKAAHFLLYAYELPPTNGDPLANFDTTVSPVRYLGRPVVLSATADVASNYPLGLTRDAFFASAQGALPNGGTTVLYAATATLLSMAPVTPYGGTHATVAQTWEITGRGRIQGAQRAEVFVSAVIERQIVPVHAYAMFALSGGCGALDLSSSVVTDSYDSSNMTLVSGVPLTDPRGGHVGTNGNLTEAGSATVIKGSLSTPRSGVGTCSSNAVTAITIKSGAQITDGLIKLPQAVKWALPEPPSTQPPTTELKIQSGITCAVVAVTSGSCTPAGANSITLDPQGTLMTLPNVQVTSGGTLSLHAGSYNLNSLKVNGNATLRILSGPVILNVAGVGQTMPVEFMSEAIVNQTFNASLLRILYAGTGAIKFADTTTSALLYAPAATVQLAGGAKFYGSILGGLVSATGGAQVHYDRRLTDIRGLGPSMLSRFTWRQR